MIEICQFHNPNSDIQLLQNILPSEYSHTICEFEEVPELNGKFKSVLRLNLTTEVEANTWLQAFQDTSKDTYRISRKHIPKKSTKVVYTLDLRCQHNTLPRTSTADQRAGSKNTKCPATVAITVKKIISNRKSRSSDIHSNSMPMIVRLNYTHNHLVNSADILKHRDVSPFVIEKFKVLYESGHSPSTAMIAHKFDMQEEHGDDYLLVSGDRSQSPDTQWCYRFYNKTFQHHYVKPDCESILVDLKRNIEVYNTEEVICTMEEEVSGGNICVALCTTLMKRVHRCYQPSGELVFLDSLGGMNHHGCRVYVMLAHSSAGGVPLGVLVTTSEAEDVLTAGLQLLTSVFPQDAFFGKSENGPDVFMSDDSQADQNALQNVFPDSHQLLSVFHILQEMWRSLLDEKHKISKEDRPHLQRLLKDMLYAKSYEELEQNYSNILTDDIACKYPCYVLLIKHIFLRKHLWAVFIRDELPIGEHETSYYELTTRMQKDDVYLRTKSFNIVQLVDFLCTRLQAYYEQRLLEVAYNKCTSISNRYQLLQHWHLEKEDIVQLSQYHFHIPSEKTPGTFYEIDLFAGVCSCFFGMNGALCKHQHMVAKHFPECIICPKCSPSLREVFFKITKGIEIDEDRFTVHIDDIFGEREGIEIKEEHTEPTTNTDFVQVIEYSDMEDDAMEDSGDEEEIQGNINGIDHFVAVLKNKYKENPQVFHKPINSFITNFHKIKTDSELISALSSFGKQSSSRNWFGNRIGVQPTAIARRKEGHRFLRQGRPIYENIGKLITANTKDKVLNNIPVQIVHDKHTTQSI
ncbi:uncharacterized protein [Antedon mediterranea]|uniref:uncharacterized protein n=1 Tax=Antedon mediterranea TaxID=105859 RepID=UPI003AF80D67